MKIIVFTLFFASLLTNTNIYSSESKKKSRRKSSHYILSSSYLNDLHKQSEEHLEILEEVYEAVEKTSIDELKGLFHKHPAICKNFVGKYYQEPIRSPLLHFAVVRGNPDIIRELLWQTADVNLPDETFIGNNNTALHLAAKLKKKTRLTICQILIKHGAHVDSKNKLGKTPLHILCEHFDDPFIAKLFIYHKADIHSQTREGRTPLHIGVSKGYKHVVNTLIACGAKPWYADNCDKTPMHIAQENIKKDPSNSSYQEILSSLEKCNSFDSFVNDLLNFEEPENKRRRIDFSE